jgi:hypothetical protein
VLKDKGVAKGQQQRLADIRQELRLRLGGDNLQRNIP